MLGEGWASCSPWHVGLARLPLRAKALYPTIAVALGLATERAICATAVRGRGRLSG
jgi:hypothetical protein